jgi:hypothetical protein
MARLIENFVPVVKYSGLNTAKAINTTSSLTALSGGAATSGGNATAAINIASATTALGVGIYFGAGAPTISAQQGSLYLNTTGSSGSTRAYINTTGSTTWTAITTAA